MIRGVVFDIDDTLYLERDYVRSGFRHVASMVARADDDREAVDGWLVAAFDAGVRGDTFDRLRVAFPSIGDRWTAAQLVTAYRRHVPDVALLPGMVAVLTELDQLGLRLGVVSDGPRDSQAAKAAALHLDRWFDPVILTDAHGPGWSKPAPLAFESLERRWDLAGSSLCYVADNPVKDFLGPNVRGWQTVRLRLPGQLHAAREASTTITTVEVDSPRALLDHLAARAREA